MRYLRGQGLYRLTEGDSYLYSILLCGVAEHQLVLGDTKALEDLSTILLA